MARRKEVRAAAQALLDELEEQYTGGDDYGYLPLTSEHENADGVQVAEVHWPKLRELQHALQNVLTSKVTVPADEDEDE